MSNKIVAKGWHQSHPWRVVQDGKRFRGQWLCALVHPNASICGAWFKTGRAAEKGAKRRIEKSPVPQIVEGGRFEKFTWPKYATRRTRNPDHRCALPGPLDAEERDELPDAAFALPKQRKYPLFVMEGGKAVPSSTHASNAKARATQQHNAGKLARRTMERIHKAADKVIAKCRRDNPEDFAKDWTVMRRPPAALDGRPVAELGKALELEVAGLRLRFTRSPHWFWEPRSKSLIFFQGGKRGRKRELEDLDVRTVAAFERFMGRGVQNEYTTGMPAVRGGEWRRAPGYAERFDYWSDKFGAPEEYTHGITSQVRVYRGGGSRPPFVWVLKGGTLRITKHGIEG